MNKTCKHVVTVQNKVTECNFGKNVILWPYFSSNSRSGSYLAFQLMSVIRVVLFLHGAKQSMNRTCIWCQLGWIGWLFDLPANTISSAILCIVVRSPSNRPCSAFNCSLLMSEQRKWRAPELLYRITPNNAYLKRRKSYQ